MFSVDMSPPLEEREQLAIDRPACTIMNDSFNFNMLNISPQRISLSEINV